MLKTPQNSCVDNSLYLKMYCYNIHTRKTKTGSTMFKEHICKLKTPTILVLISYFNVIISLSCTKGIICTLL